jgi:hypothetical protein
MTVERSNARAKRCAAESPATDDGLTEAEPDRRIAAAIERFIGPVRRSDDEERELRALELEELQLPRLAVRVRKCGTFCDGRKWRCKIRGWCPTCSADLAERYGADFAVAIQRMKFPSVFLITLPVFRLRGLAEAIDAFKSSFAMLLRRRTTRDVSGSICFLEPKMADTRRARWNLHAHLVLDVDPERLDVDAIATEWKALTKGRFSVHPESARVIAPRDLATYATKPDTWSPSAGTRLDVLEILMDAIKHRRLLTTTGSARPPRNAPIRVVERAPRSAGPLFERIERERGLTLDEFLAHGPPRNAPIRGGGSNPSPGARRLCGRERPVRVPGGPMRGVSAGLASASSTSKRAIAPPALRSNGDRAPPPVRRTDRCGPRGRASSQPSTMCAVYGGSAHCTRCQRFIASVPAGHTMSRSPTSHRSRQRA